MCHCPCDCSMPCNSNLPLYNVTHRYVLLKERNMLLTLKHEARRAGFVMPGPERAWKVSPPCHIHFV